VQHSLLRCTLLDYVFWISNISDCVFEDPKIQYFRVFSIRWLLSLTTFLANISRCNCARSSIFVMFKLLYYIFAPYLLFLAILRFCTDGNFVRGKTLSCAVYVLWIFYSEIREALSSFPLTSQFMSIWNRHVLAIREVNSYL